MTTVNARQQKALFFRLWRTHPIDRAVEAVLRDAFPEYAWEVVTLMDVLRTQRRVLARNALETARLYAPR
ncbi:MAG: hypothetical protein D6803_01580, partial [Anaerolineae bacterium]